MPDWPHISMVESGERKAPSLTETLLPAGPSEEQPSRPLFPIICLLMLGPAMAGSEGGWRGSHMPFTENHPASLSWGAPYSHHLLLLPGIQEALEAWRWHIPSDGTWDLCSCLLLGEDLRHRAAERGWLGTDSNTPLHRKVSTEKNPDKGTKWKYT